MIKKILLTTLILAVIAGICAAVHNIRVALRNKKELGKFTQKTAYTAKHGKTIVVYYSWTGKTKDIADQIAALTKADIYRIETQEEFKSSPSFYTRARKDLKDKKYPALKGNMPDFSQYDTIFIGAPVWWYTMATPLYAFLEKADFKGKKVIPFSTQGSNAGTFEKDFAAAAKNAEIGKYEKYNNVGPAYNGAVNNKIIDWLNRL